MIQTEKERSYVFDFDSAHRSSPASRAAVADANSAATHTACSSPLRRLAGRFDSPWLEVRTRPGFGHAELERPTPIGSTTS